EIHRFNKAQQDAILPFVESGLITLIGATTENPSFEVNSALLSRCRVYALHPHSREDMRKILKRATEDEDRGLASYRPEITEDAMELLISVSGGDARIALNSLEYAVITAPPEGEEGIRRVDADRMDKAICFRTSRYDKKGDGHYDIISAFIKSMRNSDADATVYWLARMIDSGEDPMFIARRMIIFASEDIGMADPIALNLASSALNGVKAVGMPEGRIILGHCACYLASAPKDNSAYRAINEALKDVREGKVYPVPKHLRNAVTDLMKDMGYGAGYKYAHDFPEGKADMQCLPDELKDRKYFKPKGPTCSGKQANQKQSD
ncbi:MAG: replication-associated recombination protein A, partial [bacterium]|nr:replication-associated recombination protein A [bacterium]